MITRSREMLDKSGFPTQKLLKGVLSEHVASLSRMDMLRRVYDGKNDILRRRRGEGLPNNRIAHPFARYIVSVTTGYLIGRNVQYVFDGENDAFDALQDALRKGNMASVDAENARNAAIFGKGVEFVHLNGEGNVCATALDPRQAFVVYDDSYDMEPLFGVYMAPIRTESGAEEGMRLYVMTKHEITRLRMRSLDDSDIETESVEAHFFGDVPLVEYWNDEGEKGDFEWVLPLINAYDTLESDRLNDKDQFVDALLVLTGCTLDTDERGREPWRQLREDKAICLPDTDASAGYLHNTMDEQGNQILRDALLEDILKFAMVPDLSDRAFAENASGVAMKYKLWGLEQLTNVKRQWFSEGLRTRLRLMLRLLSLRGYRELDEKDIRITFPSALPESLSELAGFVKSARESGAMSVTSAVRTLHGADDMSEKELARETEEIRSEGAKDGVAKE